MKFEAKLKRNYNGIFADIRVFNIGVSALLKNKEEIPVTVEIKKWHPDKSNRQLRYYFAIIKRILIHCGYPYDERHKNWLDGEIKQRFFTETKTNPKTGNTDFIPKSKADSDTQEMTELLENLRDWGSEYFGLYIPTPQEYYENEVMYN